MRRSIKWLLVILFLTLFSGGTSGMYLAYKPGPSNLEAACAVALFFSSVGLVLFSGVAIVRELLRRRRIVRRIIENV